MRNCTFHELLLVSERERSARHLKFDPNLTVVRGPNDVGKSSLVKSIYATLGAEPAIVHDKWKQAEVRSLLHFTLDGSRYSMLKAGGTFSLFDAKAELVASHSHVTAGLGPLLAKLFHFSLPLQSRGENVQATPAFLYLPFYMDQDASWTRNWASFARLAQFQNWRRSVAEFHAGIRGTPYYTAKAAADGAQTALSRAEEDLRSTSVVLDRLRGRIGQGGFAIDVSLFEAEIQRLLAECNVLAAREEAYKSQLVRLHAERRTLEQELALAIATAGELNGDLAHATSSPANHIECPTCGAEYRNDFAARFGIAVDEDHCRALAVKLRDQLDNMVARIAVAEKDRGSLLEAMERVKLVLAERKAELRMQDVVQSQGRAEISTQMESELSSLRQAVGTASDEHAVLREQVTQLDNPSRRQEITEVYRSLMRKSLDTLEVRNLSEESYACVDAQIRESGSDLPRALLAYYFTFLQVVHRFSTSTLFPIVIDSPRQQDQDDPNWAAMVEFIKNSRPAGSQTILAVVNTADVVLPGVEVALTEKYGALSGQDYEPVAGLLRPYLQRSLAAN